MYINTLRKFMGWRGALVLLTISSLLLLLGLAVASSRPAEAAAPAGTWVYATPYDCNGASGQISATLRFADGQGGTSVFTCKQVQKSASGRLIMTLTGAADKTCNPNGQTIHVGAISNDPSNPDTTHDYTDNGWGDWSRLVRDAVASCSLPPKVDIKLTNTYNQGIVNPNNTAIWTKINPGQLSATYSLPVGVTIYSQKNEIFDQTSLDSTSMVLTSKTIQDPNCGQENEIDIADPANATTGTLVTYSTTSTPSGPTCGAFQVKLSLIDKSGTPTAYKGTIPASSAPSNDSCPIDGSSMGLGWLLCPLFYMGRAAVQALNTQIQNLLFVDANLVFSPTFQQPYNAFRNIGLALLVIAGLVMVVSQAAGLEIFSAYTVRKMLPRIVVAAIGLSLAWPILQFAVTFFNDLGTLISGLILGVVHVPTGSNYTNGLQVAGAAALDILIGAGAVSVTVFSFGLFGALSLIVTVILGLLMGFIALIIRQLIIVLCVLLAPLAIAASVLPGTEKLWKIWKDSLIGMLVMFPIVMGFLASGAAVSYVAGAAATQAGSSEAGTTQTLNIIALLAYFVPYFAIPWAFRLSSGLMGQVFGMVNNRGKGIFDRLSKFRQGEKDYLHQQRMEGRTRFGSSRLGSFYRRAHTRGGFDLSSAGRQRYRQGERKAISVAAESMVSKEDAGFAANDDTANEIALQRGMTRERFIREYREATGASDDRAAERALGMLESSYGARIGSDAMRVAAFKAATRSGTSYRGRLRGQANDSPEELRQSLERLRGDAGDIVRDGLMSAEEATSAIKFNPNAGARRDRSGISYGQWLTNIQDASGANGADVVAATDASVRAMRRTVLSGNRPAELVYGRPEAVQALAPEMLDQLQHPPQGSSELLELAKIAGVYDSMAQISPENAAIMASAVMDQPAPAASGFATVRAWIDGMRDDPTFRSMRREYDRYTPLVARGPAGGAPTPGAPGAPGIPGG